MDLLKRNLFWVVLGAIVIVAVVLFVASGSVASANAQLVQQQQAALQKVKGLSASANLPTEAWVQAYDQYRAGVQSAYDELLQTIDDHSVDPYKRLPNIVDTQCSSQMINGEEVSIPIGAYFADAYPRAVAELYTTLNNAGISAVPGTTLGLGALVGPVPDQATILELQRQYWLVRDVVESLVRHQVALDSLMWVAEEFEGRGSSGLGGEPVMDQSVVQFPRFTDLGMNAIGRRRSGGRSEASMIMEQLAGGMTLGVTTTMNEFFSPYASPPAQRKLRLVCTIDFREVPLLLAALEELGSGDGPSRLSLVRKVSLQQLPSTGRVAPLVQADIRALVFDRYSEFQPIVVETGGRR
jgi:hypothetical protein